MFYESVIYLPLSQSFRSYDEFRVPLDYVSRYLNSSIIFFFLISLLIAFIAFEKS